MRISCFLWLLSNTVLAVKLYELTNVYQTFSTHARLFRPRTEVGYTGKRVTLIRSHNKQNSHRKRSS